jgi:2'-5' RNA ligase
MARLFIAVWPSDDVAAELIALRRKDARGVRFVAPENWHVTLRFLGDADPDEVASALDGMRPGAARAVVGPGVDVLDGRVVVLPVGGLEPIAAEVDARTACIGSSRPRKRFLGHLTLARLKPGAQIPPVVGALVRAEFDVDEVTLVQSRLDASGPRYEIVERWAVGES